METILDNLWAAAVHPGLQERAFLAVGAKSGVFKSLHYHFDVGEKVLIIDSSNQDVVEDTVRAWNPLQQLACQMAGAEAVPKARQLSWYLPFVRVEYKVVLGLFLYFKLKVGLAEVDLRKSLSSCG